MWDDLVLPANVVAQLDGVRSSIVEAARLPLQSPPRQTLLWGAPGTGKAAVLNAFAESMKGSGVNIDRASGPGFHGGGHIGQAGNAVREIFDRVRRAAPVVFMVDFEQGPYSDDCVFPSRESLAGGGALTAYDMERIHAAIAEMEKTCFVSKAPVWIIGEIFSPDRLDPRMRSRFSLEIELPLPDESARRGILKREIASRAAAIGGDVSGFGFDLDEACSTVAASTGGRSGRDLAYIVQKAFEKSAARDYSTPLTVTGEDLLAAAQPRH
jgi:AAA+ superfamily predicted ATPase